MFDIFPRISEILGALKSFVISGESPTFVLNSGTRSCAHLFISFKASLFMFSKSISGKGTVAPQTLTLRRRLLLKISSKKILTVENTDSTALQGEAIVLKIFLTFSKSFLALSKRSFNSLSLFSKSFFTALLAFSASSCISFKSSIIFCCISLGIEAI